MTHRLYHGFARLFKVAVVVLAASAIGCSSHSHALVESHEASSQGPSQTAPCDLGVNANSFPDSAPTNVLGGGLSAIQPPCAIAIARVVCDGAAIDRSLQLESIAPERAAFWNQLVADLPGVREVAVLRTLGMDPRGISIQDLLRESRNQECNLCLVFTIDESNASSATVRAVLWNVESGAAAVAFNTNVQLPESVIEKCSSDSDMRHRRECDASYQAEGELRRLVRDTLWDMAAKTAPGDGPTSRPNPWKSDQPILPRDDYRYRRYMLRSRT